MCSVRIRPAILLPNEITAELLVLSFQVYARAYYQSEQVLILIQVSPKISNKAKERQSQDSEADMNALKQKKKTKKPHKKPQGSL